MSDPSTIHTAQRDQSSAHLETGQLGRVQLVSLTVASYIPAVGMALVPLLLFAPGGKTAWTAALTSALAVICVGISVISFARRFVATGSIYSYIGEVFGPWAQKLAAAALVIGMVTQVSGISAIVGIFGGSFLSGLGVEWALASAPQIAIQVLATSIASFVAFRGLDTSVRIAVTLAVLSIPLVLLITGISAAHTGLQLDQQLDFSEFSLSGTLQGVAAGAAFLVGFESCASLAAETRDPKRNVPVAVMAVPVLLGALYLVTTVLQVPGLMASSELLAEGVSAPAALAITSGLGTGVAGVTDLVLAIASFGSLIAFMNYGSRLVMTIGAEGLLPARTAAVHPRYHSPHVSILLLAILSMATMTALVLVTPDIFTAYNLNATLVVFAWVLPYLLVTAGAVKLARRSKGFVAMVIVSVLGFAGMAWLYVNALINPPPAPLDSITWVAPVAILLVLIAFQLSSRRKVKRAGSLEP
ncbi:Amino acid permease family protein [Arthrobacter sp. 9V]|uniref:APC family permease n=1 Tax=Arthrobacter sp. 9V TaxID=2653132 RepID=UPI0012F0BCAA|nr:APC family permease [Arthrobacter sp. 9V]VXB55240.1 Amino acid permease family protein [Arthrobacter sp. 9V]